MRAENLGLRRERERTRPGRQLEGLTNTWLVQGERTDDAVKGGKVAGEANWTLEQVHKGGSNDGEWASKKKITLARAHRLRTYSNACMMVIASRESSVLCMRTNVQMYARTE